MCWDFHCQEGIPEQPCKDRDLEGGGRTWREGCGREGQANISHVFTAVAQVTFLVLPRGDLRRQAS